jgi:hypothetical protein
MMLRITPVTVTNKPGHRGEREATVKTIARGMPDVSGVTVVTNACAFYQCARGFCNGHRRVNPFLRHPLAGDLASVRDRRKAIA